MKTNKYFKTFFINKKSQTSNPTSKKASIKQPIQRINPKQKKETNQPLTQRHQKKLSPCNHSLASRPPLFGLVRWLGFLFLPDRVVRFNRFRFLPTFIFALPFCFLVRLSLCLPCLIACF